MSSNTLLSKLVVASARISSANRLNGTVNSFDVFLTPQISRVVGFYVSSCAITNDWYNVTSSTNTSYWQLTTDSGATAITIAPGIYDINSVCVALQTALTSQFGVTVTVTYSNITNLVSFTYNNAGTPSTGLTFDVSSGGVNGTMNTILGFTANLTSTAASLATGQSYPNLITPPFLAIGSPQMRRQSTTDTRTNGGGNCFLHLPTNNTPKLSNITYQNLAPTDASIIKFSAPAEISYLQINVTDPRSGSAIPLNYDWEIVIHFLCVA